MKNIVLHFRLLSLVIFFTTISTELLYSQSIVWKKLLDISADAVVMDNEKTIYVSGAQSGSYLWKSTDNGDSWLRLPVPDYFWYLAFDSSGVLWGGSFNGGIYKSIDKGVNWIHCFSIGQNLNALTVSPNNWIWSAATYGTVSYSSDGGTTWTQTVISGQHLYSIASDNENNIYAGGLGIIFRTSDLGQTWQTLYSGGNAWVNGIVADTGGQVYANKSGTILRSTDAGSTWFVISSGVGKGLYIDPNHNFYVSSGHYSTDNCINWEYIGPPWSAPKNYLKVDSLLFAVQDDGIYVDIPDSLPYSGNNLFPLAIGNLWQYHQWSGYNHHLRNVITTVDRDSVLPGPAGQRYFHLQGYINDWVRYDPSAKKIFLRWNDSDYTYENFNLNIGASFNKFLFNWHTLKQATVLTPEIFSIFDSVYFSRISGWVSGGAGFVQGAQNWYAEDLGYIKEEYSENGPAGTSYYQTTKLIRAILHDSTGTKYYSDHVKPVIWFTPPAPSASLILNFNFETDHVYTGYYPNGGLRERFVDSVMLYSYYQKEDSIIINEPVMMDTVAGTINYSLQYSLDSLLIQNDFDFYYKIYSVDKGIVPEFSTKPDTGWYKLDEPTDVNEKEKYIEYSLEQNYPNPFNPVTRISYSLARQGNVKITVYDLLGRKILQLVNEEKLPGRYEAEFNASGIASGIYYYRIEAGEFTKTRKMVVVK